MSRSAIRTQIEQIVNPNNENMYMFNDKRKSGVRLKFVSKKQLTTDQVNKLLQLPYVVKVGYAIYSHYGRCNGPTIYLSRKLS